MSTIYICSDTQNDMDPFLSIDREGIFAGLEDLCGGYRRDTFENESGVLEITWVDNLGDRFLVRCIPQTEIYGDKKALDQLKVSV